MFAGETMPVNANRSAKVFSALHVLIVLISAVSAAGGMLKTVFVPAAQDTFAPPFVDA